MCFLCKTLALQNWFISAFTDMNFHVGFQGILFFYRHDWFALWLIHRFWPMAHCSVSPPVIPYLLCPGLGQAFALLSSQCLHPASASDLFVFPSTWYCLLNLCANINFCKCFSGHWTFFKKKNFWGGACIGRFSKTCPFNKVLPISFRSFRYSVIYWLGEGIDKNLKSTWFLPPRNV